MILFNKISTRVKKHIFSSVLSNNLVYNTCWEDPRIDRELLSINHHSNIVMLTSAGCNALDYLIDSPAEIHCIDQNRRQNALLHLKLALFKNGNRKLLNDFFAEGFHPDAHLMYLYHLRNYLPAEHRKYWDKNINYFLGRNSDESFYFKGTSGKIAWIIKKYLIRKDIYGTIEKLLSSRTLSEQKYYFDEIEEQFWSGFTQWLINRDTTLSLLGVPLSQRKLIEKESDDGLKGFIQKAFRRVFTQLSTSDNYFWYVYLKGSYSPNCRPNYLKNEHFNFLRNHCNRISTYTTTITDFLRDNPGQYTHFILLDHQDWMVEYNAALLEEEWKLILNNAKKGAKILFRSAGSDNNFLPDFIHDHVHFKPELTRSLHQRDRVGTYGSTHLAIVN